jgi:diguanylate cyclase (GGDEF)-like protein
LCREAVRYAVEGLGFDRAFYFQSRTLDGGLRLRARHDLSAQFDYAGTVELSASDCLGLQGLASNSTARRLWRGDPQGSLSTMLDLLATDELLVVPVRVGPDTRGFLIVDCAYGCNPLDPVSAQEAATACAATLALRVRNLALRGQVRRTQQQAEFDSLTRLYNRRVGLRLIAAQVDRARRTGSPLSLSMLDLDSFKQLNDLHGHLVGDSALQIVATVLKTNYRSTDIVCRYGGEEFLVVHPDTEIEDSTMSAARVFKAVEQAGRERQIPVTVSIGLTKVNPLTDTVERAIQRADHALYASKGRGKNRFSVDAG